MSKKALPIAVFILLLAPAAADVLAQHNLQSSLNMFRPSDVLFKQQVAYKDPGRSGAAVLWDFSRLDVLNEAYELAYSSFNDTVITGTEHLTQYHYVLQNDSLLLWGFDNPTTVMKNKQPELLLKFPVAYRDSVGGYYFGHGKYGNRLELDAMGTVETKADAYGMLILPSLDTLKNVLRTHTVKYIVEDTQPITDSYYVKDTLNYTISPDSINHRLATDTVLFVVETFRWYEKGYRYPVFETVRSWEQYRNENSEEPEQNEFLATAFFYPPQEHYYLDTDEENLTILENQEKDAADPWAGLTYNIYPNPVKSSPLEVEMYLPKATGIRAQLRSTMGTTALDINKGYHPAGIYHFQLDMWNVPVGNYILDIWLEEKLISEIILKR